MQKSELSQQLAGLVTLATETLQRRRLQRGEAGSGAAEGTQAG